VDKPLAASRGIVVTNTPGVLDDSVAEHAIGLLLALARRTGRLDAKVRRGEFPAEPGCEVRGKTLAVVGFGPIGRRAAVAAHFGLGMRVLAVGRRSREELARDEGRPAEQIEAEFGLARYGNDVDAALGEADFVSIHIPASAATDRFFNAARLARIKPGAFLINTARGVVLDEDALYDALASGRLAGAAIDVFRVEPYAPQSPDKDLRALDNVLLTPHVGSCTREANERMAHASLANVRAFLAGCMADLSRVG
jgi:lactate dehydrogenase-like 2-hydroxyacid dehydrogenase